MKRFGTLLLATLFIVGSAQSCLAAETFILDHDHTTIGFNVSYLLVSNVSGQFDDFKGSFIIDRENHENSRADIIIQTASVDTGIKARHADIRGPGLFNAALYPTMVFHSSAMLVGPDNTGQITGDLTLLGMTTGAGLCSQASKRGPLRAIFFWMAIHSQTATASIKSHLWPTQLLEPR